MTNLKDMEKIDLDWLKKAITKLDTEDKNGEKWNGHIYKVVATTDEGTDLAIVVGWSDGFDEAEPHTPLADGTYRICAKIGYAPANLCWFDYDDWYMPYDLDTGDVDDTDCEVYPTKSDVNWLNREARRIWKTYRHTLDKMG